MKVRKLLNLFRFKLIFIFIIGLAVFVVLAQTLKKSANDFEPAKEFPRDALVYAQFRDLPALIKLWEESELKAKYLESGNFAGLQVSHLGIKLAERWTDLSNGIGFNLDLPTVAGFSENQAAIAIYDIGKLDIVFVAPLRDEIFQASQFFQKQANFETIAFDEDLTYYSCEIDVDRARQKQKVVFANVKGHFVLATNEKLLRRTIANIKNQTKNDRLFEENAFKELAERNVLHSAAVWVNQAKLNEDYYFRHYWLMRNVDELKSLRAGLFDFEMRDGQITEHRDFLLKEKQAGSNGSISKKNRAQMVGLLPENAPYFRLQTVENKLSSAAGSLFETILDKAVITKTKRNVSYSDDYYSDLKYQTDQSENFDININEVNILEDEAMIEESESRIKTDFQEVLAPTRPRLMLKSVLPEALEHPLFADFNKLIVLQLDSPSNLSTAKLEKVLQKALAQRLVISTPEARFDWKNAAENNLSWRELKVPLLSFEICYALKNNYLIVSNSADLLKTVLAADNQPKSITFPNFEGFDEVTVIRFDQRDAAFDQIMSRFDGENESSDFLTGNISSLLNTLSAVRYVEIKRKASVEQLQEDINFILK
jgi:hypothetical protein